MSNAAVAYLTGFSAGMFVGVLLMTFLILFRRRRTR